MLCVRGYLDNDEFIDFVITSKSKQMYIFDHNGLKLAFEYVFLF